MTTGDVACEEEPFATGSAFLPGDQITDGAALRQTVLGGNALEIMALARVLTLAAVLFGGAVTAALAGMQAAAMYLVAGSDGHALRTGRGIRGKNRPGEGERSGGSRNRSTETQSGHHVLLRNGGSPVGLGKNSMRRPSARAMRSPATRPGRHRHACLARSVFYPCVTVSSALRHRAVSPRATAASAPRRASAPLLHGCSAASCARRYDGRPSARSVRSCRCLAWR